jgi:hypothetical protein
LHFIKHVGSNIEASQLLSESDRFEELAAAANFMIEKFCGPYQSVETHARTLPQRGQNRWLQITKYPANGCYKKQPESKNS